MRADGVAKVTGEAVYAADIVFPGMAYAKFLLAGRPHARIRSMDCARARNLPGVLAVLTHADVRDVRYGPLVKDRRLFASDTVRHEGEIVAAVAATSPKTASEAIGLIDVEYDELEPVIEPMTALKHDAPLVHADWESLGHVSGLIRDQNMCGYTDIRKGDVSAGFTEAHMIRRDRYATDMSHPVPIEPHAVVARWEGRRVTIWSSTQVPFTARKGVAEALGIAENQVRVIVPHLGGGFGGKCDFHFEAHVAALARAAGRPVQLVLTRSEEFVVPDMIRHPIEIDIKTGIRADGSIVAREAELVLNAGAYASHSPAIAELATMLAAGPYRIPNLLITARSVYTNMAPTGSVRAPSGPQVCWAVEQHTDACAREARLDPVEFRRRNLVVDGDTGPTGQMLAGVSALECLEKACASIDYEKPTRSGEGVGVAVGWWYCLPYPAAAQVRINADGSATIVTGAQENGSGAVMGLAGLAADELGLRADDISILYQDTEAGLFDHGSSGSQTTVNNGRAVVAASQEVRRQLLEIAADELEIAVEDLELRDGRVAAKGAPDVSRSIAELAQRGMATGQVIAAVGSPPPPAPLSTGGVGCTGRLLFSQFQAPAFYAQAARVHVDLDTGRVDVCKVSAVHDIGAVVNRPGAEGQVEGAIAHGTGVALLEGTSHRRDGTQQNTSLTDYKLRTSADATLIDVEFLEYPAADGGPRGLKGAGEQPIVPTAGAIANAITSATGRAVHRLPMTPERVWETLNSTRENL